MGGDFWALPRGYFVSTDPRLWKPRRESNPDHEAFVALLLIRVLGASVTS